jgi:superfamily II DNA or RNA helicase
VADEVGLGKTIEAGYVVMETVARNPSARVVIVCPAGLRTKWRNELLNRFGLRFEIMDRPTAIRRVARGEDGPEDSTLRGIVSYETIRGEDFLQAINEQDGPSLLVVDEAHRTRRATTSTAESVHRLTAASD